MVHTTSVLILKKGCGIQDAGAMRKTGSDHCRIQVVFTGDVVKYFGKKSPILVRRQLRGMQRAPQCRFRMPVMPKWNHLHVITPSPSAHEDSQSQAFSFTVFLLPTLPVNFLNSDAALSHQSS